MTRVYLSVCCKPGPCGSPAYWCSWQECTVCLLKYSNCVTTRQPTLTPAVPTPWQGCTCLFVVSLVLVALQLTDVADKSVLCVCWSTATVLPPVSLPWPMLSPPHDRGVYLTCLFDYCKPGPCGPPVTDASWQECTVCVLKYSNRVATRQPTLTHAVPTPWQGCTCLFVVSLVLVALQLLMLADKSVLYVCWSTATVLPPIRLPWLMLCPPHCMTVITRVYMSVLKPPSTCPCYPQSVDALHPSAYPEFCTACFQFIVITLIQS